jgi:hypothetical protein
VAQWRWGWRCDAQREGRSRLLLDEVEARVVPSREVTAAAKLLSEPGRRVFAQVMDQEHGEVEVPLERAQ